MNCPLCTYVQIAKEKDDIDKKISEERLKLSLHIISVHGYHAFARLERLPLE